MIETVDEAERTKIKDEDESKELRTHQTNESDDNQTTLQRNRTERDPKNKERLKGLKDHRIAESSENILQYRLFDDSEHEPNIRCVCRLCQTNRKVSEQGEWEREGGHIGGTRSTVPYSLT